MIGVPVTIKKNGNILGLVWKYRNHFRMISNIYGISKVGDRSEIVSNYNIFMG